MFGQPIFGGNQFGGPYPLSTTPLVFVSGTGTATASSRLGSIVAHSVGGIGTSTASSKLGYRLAKPASGTGVSTASGQLGYRLAKPASGIGSATSSTSLGAFVAKNAQGFGISTASSRLSSISITPIAGSGAGRALSSARFPSLIGAGKGITAASALLSSFSVYIPGPAIPGFPSVSQTVPQYVNWFGYTMKPILDVLKLRYPRIKYTSPPVCQVLTPRSGSSMPMVAPGWL